MTYGWSAAQPVMIASTAGPPMTGPIRSRMMLTAPRRRRTPDRGQQAKTRCGRYSGQGGHGRVPVSHLPAALTTKSNGTGQDAHGTLAGRPGRTIRSLPWDGLRPTVCSASRDFRVGLGVGASRMIASFFSFLRFPGRRRRCFAPPSFGSGIGGRPGRRHRIVAGAVAAPDRERQKVLLADAAKAGDSLDEESLRSQLQDFAMNMSSCFSKAPTLPRLRFLRLSAGKIDMRRESMAMRSRRTSSTRTFPWLKTSWQLLGGRGQPLER